MRCIKVLAAVGMMAALAAPLSIQARQEKEGAKLTGKWTVTAADKDGKKFNDAKDKTVTITQDTITCQNKDNKTDMICKYTLDTASKPWRITLDCTEGEHKGKKLEGIVLVDGKKAVLCFAKPGEKAPDNLTSTKEGQCCFVLKRTE